MVGRFCEKPASAGRSRSHERWASVAGGLPAPLPTRDREHECGLAPFLVDLNACRLSQVTWVIPDGRWSDHPLTGGLGPDWVANIVNSVGGVGNTCGFWNNTVVLIVWDDWGGWFDHVSPTDPNHGLPGGVAGYGDGTGNGQQYVHGFRVPLLVVSAYVKKPGGQPGYVSQIPHDFGSILQFIKSTFGLGSYEIDPQYFYADHFARIRGDELTDFFDYTQQQRPFVQIQLGPPNCDVACFEQKTGSSTDPDPDDDADLD
jgi:phospholipase C